MNFLYFLSTFLNACYRYIFPCICAYCKKFLPNKNIFCNDCHNKIIPIVSKKIDITPSISMTVFAVSDYKDPLKKLILGKSWSDSLMGYYLGQLIWEKTTIKDLDFDVIVPIPLHWTRYAWRGFNQAHEIARVISKKKNVPVKQLLTRIKKTVYQSAIASHARGENVKNAFIFNKFLFRGPQLQCNEDWRGKHILLVDDLMTTGATLRAAAKVLLSLKPRKITVVVACRVI